MFIHVMQFWIDSILHTRGTRGIIFSTDTHRACCTLNKEKILNIKILYLATIRFFLYFFQQLYQFNRSLMSFR